MDQLPTSVDRLQSSAPITDHKKSLESSDSCPKPPPSPCTPLWAQGENEKLPPSFDPHRFGKEDGIGFFGACVHIIKGTIGSGILTVPYVMKNLGCFPGTVLMVFVGILCYHNAHILVSTEYRLCKILQIPRLTLLGITKNSFQRAPFPINKFGSFVSCLLCFYFGLPTFLAMYLIVLSTNIQHMASYCDVKLNQTYVITAISIPFILFTLARRILKILVPFSFVANIFTLIMAGVLITCSIIYRKEDVSVRQFGDALFIPKGFAMLIVIVGCTGIIMPIKNDMRKPKSFTGLFGSLNICGGTIVLINYCFAIISYINYGEEVQENILHNLPENNFVSFTIYLLYTLMLSVSYVLLFFVCFDCVWTSQLEAHLSAGTWKTLCEYLLRVGINIVAYCLAVGVRHISLITAMTGTLGILVEIALAPILEILLLLNEKEKRMVIILKDLCIVIISAVLFCMSTTQCVRDVIKQYTD